MFISAPFSSNTLQTSSRPKKAAHWRGVQLSCVPLILFQSVHRVHLNTDITHVSKSMNISSCFNQQCAGVTFTVISSVMQRSIPGLPCSIDWISRFIIMHSSLTTSVTHSSKSIDVSSLLNQQLANFNLTLISSKMKWSIVALLFSHSFTSASPWSWQVDKIQSMQGSESFCTRDDWGWWVIVFDSKMRKSYLVSSVHWNALVDQLGQDIRWGPTNGSNVQQSLFSRASGC